MYCVTQKIIIPTCQKNIAYLNTGLSGVAFEILIKTNANTAGSWNQERFTHFLCIICILCDIYTMLSNKLHFTLSRLLHDEEKKLTLISIFTLPCGA